MLELDRKSPNRPGAGIVVTPVSGPMTVTYVIVSHNDYRGWANLTGLGWRNAPRFP
jgi:hypothetical protein